MASLANANLPSDDDEDEDYVPGSNLAADGAGERRQKCNVEPAGQSSANGGKRVATRESEVEPAVKKARRENAAAVWEKLNMKTSTKLSPKNKSIDISNVCREVNVKTCDPDKFWRSSLGVKKPSKSVRKHSVVAERNTMETEPPVNRTMFAKSAKAAVKDALSVTTPQMYGKATVAETRMFGGQAVEVKKVVEASAQPEKVAATKGFDAFLESLDGKKKVTVLDKSRSDWKDHKMVNQDLEEELEIHKRSNDQYLDKVNFLQRASIKEHEKERDEKLASDVRTRGRL